MIGKIINRWHTSRNCIDSSPQTKSEVTWLNMLQCLYLYFHHFNEWFQDRFVVSKEHYFAFQAIKATADWLRVWFKRTGQLVSYLLRSTYSASYICSLWWIHGEMSEKIRWKITNVKVLWEFSSFSRIKLLAIKQNQVRKLFFSFRSPKLGRNCSGWEICLYVIIAQDVFNVRWTFKSMNSSEDVFTVHCSWALILGTGKIHWIVDIHNFG